MAAEVKIRIVTEDQASRELQKTTSSLGKMAKALIGIGAAKKAFDFTKEATLLTARVDTLAVVTAKLGANVGKSEEEIRTIEESIQSLGITTQASRQAVAQMIQSNLDLADATKIARLAQDTAVIANENSSESFQALTTIIATGNTLMARRRGLLVDFQGAYQRLAKELGKSTLELTQEEKILARTNEVMKQGVNIAGTYEAAMETVGKKLSSFPRIWEEYKLAFGQYFQTALGEGIDISSDFLKVLTRTRKEVDAGNLTMGEARRILLNWVLAGRTAEQTMAALDRKTGALTKKTIELANYTGDADRIFSRYKVTIDQNTGAVLVYYETISDLPRQLEWWQRSQDDVNSSLKTTADRLNAIDTNLSGTISRFQEAAKLEELGIGKVQSQLDKVLTSTLEGPALQEALDTLLLRAVDIELEAGTIDVDQAAETIAEQLGIGLEQALDIVAELQGRINSLTGTTVYVDIVERHTGSITNQGAGGQGKKGGSKKTGESGLSEKAFGGPVFSGTPVLVGEKGPEVFMPSQAGTVIPNNEVAGMGGQVVITNNIYNPLAAAIVGSQVDNAVKGRLNNFMRAA